LTCLMAGNPSEPTIGSYLYEPSYCMDGQLRSDARTYLPQPGDVMLATDRNRFSKTTHEMSLPSDPHNPATTIPPPAVARPVRESCVAAGLVDCLTTRPSATYPHELFFDQSYNRYLRDHLPLIHDWEPPARWVPCCVR